MEEYQVQCHFTKLIVMKSRLLLFNNRHFFCDEYANENPELLGQYIHSCSNDVLSASITSALQEIS